MGIKVPEVGSSLGDGLNVIGAYSNTMEMSARLC